MVGENTESPNEKPEPHWRKNLRPGDHGQPKPGRPPLSAAQTAAKEASTREIAETWQELKEMTMEELKEIKARKEQQPLVRLWMAEAMIQGIKRGDLTELHRMYNRLLGMPKEDKNVKVTGTMKIDMSKLPTAALIRIRAGEDPEAVAAEYKHE